MKPSLRIKIQNSARHQQHPLPAPLHNSLYNNLQRSPKPQKTKGKSRKIISNCLWTQADPALFYVHVLLSLLLHSEHHHFHGPTHPLFQVLSVVASHAVRADFDPCVPLYQVLRFLEFVFAGDCEGDLHYGSRHNYGNQSVC